MQLHPHPATAAEEDSAAPVDLSATPGPPRRSSRLRRRLLWAGGLLVLLLLLIFLPPLINANHYQREVARSMSASLGRPVHLDNVTLHLLPVPGLTLQNLVVSEDPAFGAEPTIRANTVEATLRLSSLWRRRVEFSTVEFVEPSVNLVRNPAGRWNLANVLFHAAHVETAPTVQRHPGPAPRFPYIEATGGRVNIKLADEKLPYSLTEADFALWQPAPGQWRVRLQGQPARTDAYITDPGTLRMEGDLKRGPEAGPDAGSVPLSLRASWHDAPMGEATRLLLGDDMGWRGTLNLDATLAGTLDAARLDSRLTLGGLRRADFAPAHPLDLQVTCGAGLAIETVSLSDLVCALPTGAPQPMQLRSALLNLQHPETTSATVTAQQVPIRWALLWAALFSPRVPTDLQPAGTIDLSFTHTPDGTPRAPTAPETRNRRRHILPAAAAASPAPETRNPWSDWSDWNGELTMSIPPAPADAQTPGVPVGGAAPLQLVWRTERGADPAALPTLRLQPTAVRFAPDSTLTVSAVISAAGYTFAANGSATAAAVLSPARYLPQLGDGLNQILPYPPTGAALTRFNFSCAHPWGGAQSCTGPHSGNPGARDGGAGIPATVVPGSTSLPPQLGTPQPNALGPRSLSPFDYAPRLGGTPSGAPADTPPPTPPATLPAAPSPHL